MGFLHWLLLLGAVCVGAIPAPMAPGKAVAPALPAKPEIWLAEEFQNYHAGPWKAGFSKAWYVPTNMTGPPLRCPDNIYKGVTLDPKDVKNAGYPNFREAAARWKCNRGNTILIPVYCTMASYDSTEVICPPSLKTPNDIALYDWDPFTRATAFDKCQGLRTMLSMYIIVGNNTMNGTNPTKIGQDWVNETQWNAWFKSFGENVLDMAQFANDHYVNAITIGNELTASQAQDKQWRMLIAAVKAKFKGPIKPEVTYLARKTAVGDIQWWDALDFISVKPTYSLAGSSSSLDDLITAWIPITEGLEKLSDKFKKRVVLQALGYRSAVGSNKCPECKDPTDAVDTELQGRLFAAVYETWCPLSWFGGLFWEGWSQQIQLDIAMAGDSNTQRFIGKPAEKEVRKYHRAIDTCEEQQSRAMQCEEATTWHGAWGTK